MLSFQILVFSFLANLAPMQSAKDEFVFNNRAEPESIDPHFATGVPDNNIVIQMFEGLMTRQADWATLAPGQAESYKISEDGLTYTFTLRPNLKWSDGSPLTAEDFAYSFRRAVHPATAASYAYWFTDTIVGAADYAKEQTPARSAAMGVKALDDRTLQIQLKKPVPYFLQILAESLSYPVKKSVVEKHGDRWTRPGNIVVNGPFVISDWKVQDKIVLSKNPHYWDAANVKISRAVAIPLIERQTAVDLFRQGRLDWTGQNGAPNAIVPSQLKNPHFRVHQGFVTYFYRFNTTRPPLNDVRVRQALALAINRSEIVDRVTRAGETVATTFVPPGAGTYKSAEPMISEDHAKNLEKARALLAEAGFPGGKGLRTLDLLYNTDENHKRIALALQQMWKRDLGVNVVPVNQEWKVYLKSQTALDYDISRSGWSGDYPDPATFLELFTSSSDNNQTGWKNADYDKLFAESARTLDPVKRAELLRQVETILLNQGPIAPVYFYTNFGFLRPEIQGFIPNPVDRPFVKYLSKK
jgi:oligopeptide transport system substrate-binding protein